METLRRNTKKRSAILECIQGTTCHPTADWVFRQLKPAIPDLSLGTVYRNLSRFKEQGQIVSLGTVKGVERFDGNTAPHVHFVCSECGGVLDLQGVAVPAELQSAVANTTGGEVTGCQLTFTGVCMGCQNLSKEESA